MNKDKEMKMRKIIERDRIKLSEKDVIIEDLQYTIRKYEKILSGIFGNDSYKNFLVWKDGTICEWSEEELDTAVNNLIEQWKIERKNHELSEESKQSIHNIRDKVREYKEHRNKSCHGFKKR